MKNKNSKYFISFWISTRWALIPIVLGSLPTVILVRAAGPFAGRLLGSEAATSS